MKPVQWKLFRAWRKTIGSYRWNAGPSDATQRRLFQRTAGSEQAVNDKAPAVNINSGLRGKKKKKKGVNTPRKTGVRSERDALALSQTSPGHMLAHELLFHLSPTWIIPCFSTVARLNLLRERLLRESGDLI